MQFLQIGSNNEDVRALQKALAKELNLKISADGVFGPGTSRALSSWQQSQGINEVDARGNAVYGKKSDDVAGSYIEENFITEAGYAQAAEHLGVEVAALKAFALTESKGRGFFSNGFPVILFERHKFYQAVRLKFGVARANALAAQMPDICNPNAGGYVGNEGEIPRLERASNIDWLCAHSSASWGAYQVMGFNYSRAGYQSVQEFIEAVKRSEKEQLIGFVNFVGYDANLVQALRAKNWRVVAALYNGSGNVSDYAPKFAANYDLAIRQR